MKPMLAKDFDFDKLQNSFSIQPKLDGIRLIGSDGIFLSRNGKPIKGVPEIIKELKKFNIPIDGELYAHGQRFEDTISSVRRTVNIDEDYTIEFHVFDTPIENKHFPERYLILKEEFKKHEFNRIKLVDTIFTRDKLEIFEVLHKQLLNGYEGVMVRNDFGFYEPRRTWNLMKLKTSQECEIEIISIEKGEGKYNNCLGAIKGRLPNGEIVKVGTGFSDKQRQEFNETIIGKIATIKFQELTKYNIPRFPVFKAIRDYE